MTSTTPEGLFYLAEEQILLCTTCQIGIRPGRLAKKHLRDFHQWKGEQLQTALSYISTRQLRDPQTVDLPANGRTVIPALGRPWHGYRCQSCAYLSRSQKMIRVHIGQARHRREEREETGWERVWLQTFLRGRHARYWIVSDGEKNGEGKEEKEEKELRHDSTGQPRDAAEQREDDGWMEMLSTYEAARARE